MGGLGARAHLASGLMPGRGWPRWCGAWLASVVRGVAGLGGAGARPPAGLIRSPCRPRSCCLGGAVLGCAAGACVPVGLLLGLVVGHPVRERRACCRCRPGHQGLLEEDHVV